MNLRTTGHPANTNHQGEHPVSHKPDGTPHDPIEALLADMAAFDPLETLLADLAAFDPIDALVAAIAAFDPLEAAIADVIAYDPTEAILANLDTYDPTEAILANLTEGRVIVAHARPNVTVRATCRGDGTVYRLGWDAGSWWCDCPARSDECSHLHALRLVTAPDLGPGQP